MRLRAANKESHMGLGTIVGRKHSKRVSRHVTGVRQATGGKMAPAVPHAPEMDGTQIHFVKRLRAANKESHMGLGTIVGRKQSKRVSRHVTGVRQATGGKMAPAVPHAPEMDGTQIHFVKVL
ncbi:hypothetical protein NQZ68_004884 [Dissostichus eleginoides]|nr:hypothetical protein NQZ68_004884 [Dissostichus eleginoides]